MVSLGTKITWFVFGKVYTCFELVVLTKSTTKLVAYELSTLSFVTMTHNHPNHPQSLTDYSGIYKTALERHFMNWC